MITIPIVGERTPSGCVDIIIVLQDDNIARLKAADPAEINMAKFPAEIAALKVNRIMIAYETPANCAVLEGLAARHDIGGIVKMLLRGFKFKPEAGDCDNPYERMA